MADPMGMGPKDEMFQDRKDETSNVLKRTEDLVS